MPIHFLRGLTLTVCFVLAACRTPPIAEQPEPEPAGSPQVVETQIGSDQYRAVRQLLGGDLKNDPQLTTYVRLLGHKLANSSQRGLPYEFSVVNNSVPNAWALPGGHIAVSRGLLQKLECDAQLAAVLAVEIVRVPAERAADPEESEFVSRGARAAAQLTAKDNEFADFVVGDGALAANLLAPQSTGQSTEQAAEKDERTVDREAMLYMKHAGYDPAAAVSLQEMLLRQVSNQDWLAGLLATRPVSAERVKNARQSLTQIGAGGTFGCKEYKRATTKLRKLAPAYQAYDEAVSARERGDLATADVQARKALALTQDDPKFHVLLGDVALKRDQQADALAYYRRAIEIDPEYFEPYVSAGIVTYQLGDRDASAKLLDRSMALLPTAAAAYHLGRISQEQDNLEQAIQYYQLAAASDSEIGRDAARELVVLDLSRNPGRYVHVEPQVDEATGRVWMEVRNQAPVVVDNVVVAAALAKPEGGVIQGPVEVDTGSAALAPGTVTRIPTSLGPLRKGDSIRLVQAQVSAAKVADEHAAPSNERTPSDDSERPRGNSLR